MPRTPVTRVQHLQELLTEYQGYVDHCQRPEALRSRDAAGQAQYREHTARQELLVELISSALAEEVAR